MRFPLFKICLLTLFLGSFRTAMAQDSRSQLPLGLENAYTEVNIGFINYPFSASQFAKNVPGYVFQSVGNTHYPAVRLVLYGYEFNPFLSAQVTYMRPVHWVHYKHLYNGTSHTAHVWMNVGGLTLKPKLPIGKHFSLFGEGGKALVTRHGFYADNGAPLVSNAAYAYYLFGAGIKYHLNAKWALQLSTTYSPEKKSVDQPAITYVSGGFSYKLLKTPKEQIEKAAKAGYIHPKNLLQIGYASNIIGYGVNNAFAKANLFWSGEAEVRQGLSFNYQRNVYHGAKYFSFNIGVSAGFWQTKTLKQDFYAFSIYPLFRYDFLHAKPFDAYFYYSVAGPSYISDIFIDKKNTGEHFTFQDEIGSGVFFGAKRNYNLEIKIGHYSNGNIFPHNDAVTIPLSINVGYAF